MPETSQVPLRVALAGKAEIPPFSIMLPPGWVAFAADDSTRDRMLEAAGRRLMQAHRPDLHAQLRALVRRSWADLQKVGAQYAFGPGPDAPDAAYLPASLTASVRTAPANTSFSQVVSRLIQQDSAKPLGDDLRFVTFRKTKTISEGGQRLRTTSAFYLTPMPGSGARALQFSAVVAHPDDVEQEAEPVQELLSLFDAHVSTFSWAAR
jgi:hypothetical protein